MSPRDETGYEVGLETAQKTGEPREPHKPSVHVRIDGIMDEEMVRLVVREELARLLKLATREL